MTQTNGWRAKSIKTVREERRQRNDEIARLRRERVEGTELTAAEHHQVQLDLRASFYARLEGKAA